MKFKGLNDNKVTVESGISNGLIGKGRKRGSLSQDNISKILYAYPDLSADWLMTGRGEMIHEENLPSLNFERKGIPYYDVDFCGGFDVMLNDQTAIPAGWIDLPAYEKADTWANITGHSMEPLIHHGDVIALRKVNDWNNYILYGEIYGIVTDEYRTVKRLRKSKKPNTIILEPENKSDFDDQEIPREQIRQIWAVLGFMRKIF